MLGILRSNNWEEILSVFNNIVIEIIDIGIFKHTDKANKELYCLKIFSVREKKYKSKIKEINIL